MIVLFWYLLLLLSTSRTSPAVYKAEYNTMNGIEDSMQVHNKGGKVWTASLQGSFKRQSLPGRIAGQSFSNFFESKSPIVHVQGVNNEQKYRRMS